MDREEIEFGAGEDRCAAWLYPAAGDDAMTPVVVMAHGLSGTRRDGLGPFAERFAAAGIAALVFDHRGFGDSGGEADLFEPKRQLEDWRAAIAFARSLPGIDPERVGDLRLLDGRRQRARGGGRGPARGRGGQPGPVPRHGAPGAPLLPPGRGADAGRGGPRQTPAGDRAAARGGVHQRAGRRDGLAPRGRDRRGLALAQPRLLALAARRSLPPRPPRRRAPLPLAALRRRGRPGRQARPGDRRGAAGPARRAAHLPRRRPLRHLRRRRVRGRRRRRGRVPASPPARLQPEDSLSSKRDQSPVRPRCWW